MFTRPMCCAHCGDGLQVSVDESGYIWEWCGSCQRSSAVTVMLPRGLHRHDQRERLEAELRDQVAKEQRATLDKRKSNGRMRPISLGFRRGDE